MHEAHEVEDVRVVLGGLHADVVQRGGVAEVVLGGVGVGVEHEFGPEDLLRLLGAPGEQVVEVRIDAQQHLLRRVGDHAHEHLLALGQVAAVGHRDLETQVGVVEVVEDAAPEGHVLIALDVDPHQPLVRVGGQRPGQFVERRRTREGVHAAQFFPNLGSHTSTKIEILLILRKITAPFRRFIPTFRTTSYGRQRLEIPPRDGLLDQSRFRIPDRRTVRAETLPPARQQLRGVARPQAACRQGRDARTGASSGAARTSPSWPACSRRGAASAVPRSRARSSSRATTATAWSIYSPGRLRLQKGGLLT